MPPPVGAAPGRKMKPQFSLGSLAAPKSTPFQNFSRYVDPSGRLNFSGKAILHAEGVDFSSGSSYKIRMDDLELLEELGKGQYGTVQKVHHTPTNVTMAMKEIRLELDQNALNQILMELEVLHKSQSPFIVEFYGAFFIESCVYYCMEYMDAGSLDRLYEWGMPEDVLAKITYAMTKGLKFLKDELSIIHRDVKPTNVLVNQKGEVKLCDFGVSGKLVQSLAKTNIGCQIYMPPERITHGEEGTYTVQSDIWALGLSIVEMALGHYPYQGTQFDSIFAQLRAIVAGDPPNLPEDKYSQDCRDFIAKCLNKTPSNRPSYAELLATPWLQKYESADVDMEGWARNAFERRKAKQQAALEAKVEDEGREGGVAAGKGADQGQES
ncbi:MAP kinase kinase Wis1 [Borealophlyctis nickersoniae]|nr:MAP kinase kinase Wis1 [Borealophlyctis nickersoniae]